LKANGNVKKSYQRDESVDKLSNNVPAGEFDIIGGNYSTADVNATRSSNKRLSMKGTYSTVNDDTPRSSTNRLSMDGNYSTIILFLTRFTFPCFVHNSIDLIRLTCSLPFTSTNCRNIFSTFINNLRIQN
jgi:hypothetical protein